MTLGNIGATFERKNETELAILFYKQSLNITEKIRTELRTLPPQEQRAYAGRIQGYYRSLADLLAFGGCC